MDHLTALIQWFIAPENFAGTLTYFAVYLCSPLLVSLAIEGIKTDRIVRKLRRYRAIEIRGYQVVGTAVLSIFIASGPGIMDAGDATNHGIAAGLFSALTMHVIKASLESRWPKLHDAIFFAEKRKRAVFEGRTFDPNETTTTGPIHREDASND